MEAGVTVYAPIRRLEAIESQKGALIEKVVEFFPGASGASSGQQ
jgi:hypothetical protein